MFHISNLGKFGANVEFYADTRGFVPEHGDLIDDFNYPGRGGPHYWEEWVASAERATKAAEQAIAKWREGPNSS